MRVIQASMILWVACAVLSLRAAEGGKVTGKVTWAGDAPKPVLMDITSKPDDLKTCQCKPDETAKVSPRLLVDKETKGVKYTVVTLEGVPEDKAKKFPEREALIDQSHCEFAPHIQWVEVDQQLTVKNSDNTLHNVHAKTEDGDVFNFSMPEKDQVIKKKLKDAGLLMLNCDAGHSWMNGFVFVVENPYIAITDDKGDFTIDGVPPGKYKLKFWHEGWQVTPVLDQKTQKPIAYKFSDPVTSEIEVEVKGDASANVTLSDAGFKK
jgi:hypothetical protein